MRVRATSNQAWCSNIVLGVPTRAAAPAATTWGSRQAREFNTYKYNRLLILGIRHTPTSPTPSDSAS